MDCEAVSAESMDCEIANLHKALLCIFLVFLCKGLFPRIDNDPKVIIAAYNSQSPLSK